MESESVNVRGIDPCSEVIIFLNEQGKKQQECQHDWKLREHVMTGRRPLPPNTITTSGSYSTFEVICLKCGLVETRRLTKTCPKCLLPLQKDETPQDLSRYLDSYWIDNYLEDMAAILHQCPKCKLTVVDPVRP
jgi:hypothetical protein